MLKQEYVVSGSELEGGGVVFTVVPERGQIDLAYASTPQRTSQFVVSVRESGGDIQFDWSRSPYDPGAAQSEIEGEIRARMQERADWLIRVRKLVAEVDRWATSLGWSTKQVEKKLDDTRVGSHRVPALVMQADTVRIMLEPIGRSAPGADGIVDLYLMPGYDDIASIYFYDGRWNLHNAFVQRHAASIRDAEGTPLSRESLERVLGEMSQHAA